MNIQKLLYLVSNLQSYKVYFGQSSKTRPKWESIMTILTIPLMVPTLKILSHSPILNSHLFGHWQRDAKTWWPTPTQSDHFRSLLKVQSIKNHLILESLNFDREQSYGCEDVTFPFPCRDQFRRQLAVCSNINNGTSLIGISLRFWKLLK